MIYGDCMCPEPEIASSMTISVRHTTDMDGTKCPKWKEKNTE